MVQFLSNQLFFLFMSDCDNRLLVLAEVMDGEVVPHTEKFSEWISWGTKISCCLTKPSRAIPSEAYRMPALDAGGQETTIYRQRGAGNIAGRWRT